MVMMMMMMRMGNFAHDPRQFRASGEDTNSFCDFVVVAGSEGKCALGGLVCLVP